MGECFFWYRPTRVVPDQRPLNGRCCCTCSEEPVLARNLWNQPGGCEWWEGLGKKVNFEPGTVVFWGMANNNSVTSIVMRWQTDKKLIKYPSICLS